MSEILRKHGITIRNCLFKLEWNIEDTTNLHSFFVDDLEQAMTIHHCDALNKYLSGNTERRINLDSREVARNPDDNALFDALRPGKYPLGRFPTKTEYALSLMQQVAVNLAINNDAKDDILSINGPPGTGKTTLLRDIFADFVVKQAHLMTMRHQKEITTPDNTYFGKTSIGELPEEMTKYAIVVTSSNNGAVQNIVNELPLAKAGDFDPELLQELLKADYFCDIANLRPKEKRVATPSGNKEMNPKERRKENERWGLFSLEGGKKENVDTIITRVNEVFEYLDKEYRPDPDVYKEFDQAYREVKEQRDRIERKLENREECEILKQKFSDIRANYATEKYERQQAIDRQSRELEEQIAQLQQKLTRKRNDIRDEKERTLDLYPAIDELKQRYREQKAEKPFFFARRKTKAAYAAELQACQEEYQALQDELETARRRIDDDTADATKLERALEQACRNRDKLPKMEDWEREIENKIRKLKETYDELARDSITDGDGLDFSMDYEALQMVNPWFDESYRKSQSRLFILALRVRKQFLYDNRTNLKRAAGIWKHRESHKQRPRVTAAAWHWINLAIPVISSTFASFGNMMRTIAPQALGHIFVDEAGQAAPQAAVGAIFRSRRFIAVGDPLQIKPIVTLENKVLRLLGDRYDIGDQYLSTSASVQALADAAGCYGFYHDKINNPQAWIGIPLWVHRRCYDPMFTISNKISYHGLMVQAADKCGKSAWYDIAGTAKDKYVEEQGEFLKAKLLEMSRLNPAITEPGTKDTVFVITPFKNVARRLAEKLDEAPLGFTRRKNGKPVNIGTIHTFQGKEAPVVFLVLGADNNSRGAAAWAVMESNMMNVAVTRAKEEFYIIGDKTLYESLGSQVIETTLKTIEDFQEKHSDKMPHPEKEER